MLLQYDKALLLCFPLERTVIRTVRGSGKTAQKQLAHLCATTHGLKSNLDSKKAFLDEVNVKLQHPWIRPQLGDRVKRELPTLFDTSSKRWTHDGERKKVRKSSSVKTTRLISTRSAVAGFTACCQNTKWVQGRRKLDRKCHLADLQHRLSPGKKSGFHSFSRFNSGWTPPNSWFESNCCWSTLA